MLKIIPTPEFSKSVKKLAKNYRQIGWDLEKLKQTIVDNPRSGVDLGSSCYKIRIPNSSIPTGKSGGFRVITYYDEGRNTVRLLLIYSKRDQESISDRELQDVLKNIAT